MRRREFTAGLGAAAVTWVPMALGQQPERVRRVMSPLGSNAVASVCSGNALPNWGGSRERTCVSMSAQG
jgi:hypothetical protein